MTDNVVKIRNPGAAVATDREASGPARRRARLPSRGRGVVSFEALLTATEKLLLTHDADDLGLYQIAEAAGVKPATAYHFFPTTNAVFIALAERYHADFRRNSRKPHLASQLVSWQDLIVTGHERAVAYYNEHLAAAKILLGMHPSGDVHRADLAYNEITSTTAFQAFDLFFVMPHVSDFQHKFEVMMALADSVWALSFERNGKITQRYAEDATAACIAYCKTFLPDRVERRPAVAEAARTGDYIGIDMLESAQN